MTMTAASPRRRKGKPFNPAHDRRAQDLLRNAQVAPAEVDDPYEEGGKILVMRSTRDDPLAGMHARKTIDDAQYMGGRAFQRDFETAERGPRAIDPGKEAVDGGLTPEPISEAQRKAAYRLKRAYRALGADGCALMHDVLVHAMTQKQIARARGLAGERWEKFFGMRVHECLHRLSYVYGFATEKTGKKRIGELV